MEDKFIFIITIIFYYVAIILGGLFNLIFGILGNSIIGNTSMSLFYLLYVILPICLLLVPIYSYFMFKDKNAKIIKCSFVSLILFIVLFFGTVIGLKGYFIKFSKDKWNNYNANRHYMINDIENNYNLIGKSKNEIVQLLGTNYIENTDNSTIMYDINYSLASVQYYELYYEDDCVIRTDVEWLD